MHEGDQNDVLTRCGIVRRQRFEALSDAIHLPAVVASPLIVKLDNGELVRRAFHEAVKRLMLLVRHNPDGSHGLDRRETLQTVIHDRAPFLLQAIKRPASKCRKIAQRYRAAGVARSDSRHNRSAPSRAELRRYPAFAAGQAASSVRSPATKASGWSIITWCSASGIST